MSEIDNVIAQEIKNLFSQGVDFGSTDEEKAHNVKEYARVRKQEYEIQKRSDLYARSASSFKSSLGNIGESENVASLTQNISNTNKNIDTINNILNNNYDLDKSMNILNELNRGYHESESKKSLLAMLPYIYQANSQADSVRYQTDKANETTMLIEGNRLKGELTAALIPKLQEATMALQGKKNSKESTNAIKNINLLVGLLNNAMMGLGNQQTQDNQNGQQQPSNGQLDLYQSFFPPSK